MIIAFIKEVRLRHEAKDKLSYSDYKIAEDCLKQWTYKGDFKAAIANTVDDAVAVFQSELKSKLVHSSLDVLGDNFMFRLGYNEVKDGRFHPSSGFYVDGGWHYIE